MWRCRIHFFCPILPSYAEQFLYGCVDFHPFRVLGGPIWHRFQPFRRRKSGSRALRGRLFAFVLKKMKIYLADNQHIALHDAK